MVQWLRRRFVTGFVVTVPLVISLVALVWVFRIVDGFVGPVYRRWVAFEIPGLGIVTTAALILMVGVVATNVIGKRLLQRAEGYLMRVPVFRTIYSPVKQLLAAFSPDNESGLKRVVMVSDASGAARLGFLTKEFEVDGGPGVGPQAYAAIYVPTNNLYLGDVFVYRRDALRFPQISVEEGVRVFLTGGMAMPGRLAVRPDEAGHLSS